MSAQGAELVTFGKRVAAAAGFDVSRADVDWAGYGKAQQRAWPQLIPIGRYLRPGVAVLGSTKTPTRQVAEPAHVRRKQGYIEPRNAREVMRLRELGVISRTDARRYLGLRAHWWSRG